MGWSLNLIQHPAFGTHLYSRRHQLLQARNKMKVTVSILGSSANPYAFKKGKAPAF